MAKKNAVIVLVVFAGFLMLLSGFYLGRRTVKGIKVSADRTIPTADYAAQAQAGSRININTATAVELEQLPTIGATIAERIVAYREAHGDFTGISELMNVEGIGETRYEAIKDYITVR